MPSPHKEYCGIHSAQFWHNDDIGPCWKHLVFVSPFGVFLAWWGVGSFLLTRARHPKVLRLTQIGALDIVRTLLCIVLALEAPVLLLLIDAEPQKHEYVDAFLASTAQWLFLGAMVTSSAVRATKDTHVMRIAAGLSLFSRTLLLHSMLNSGENDYGSDYSLRKDWMIGGFALTLIATFLISCVARDHRALAKTARAQIVEESNPLQESLLGSVPRPALFEDLGDERTSPEEYVGLFSQLTFTWLSNLMRLGYMRPLSLKDLYRVRKEDSASVLYHNFESSLSRGDGLIKALYTGGALSPFLLAVPFKAVYDILLYAGPAKLLRAFIEYLNEAPENDQWYTSRGTKIALIMFGVSVLMTLTLHVYFNLVFRAGMRVRTALVTAVFNKSLRLSLSARNSQSTGAIANLISTDAQRMQDLFPYLHVVWSSPLQIAICTYFLWQELRWAAVVALATIIVSIFGLTGLIASRMKAMNKELMASKDDRIRKTTEALSTMKLIKLYGWESTFKTQIEGARLQELKLLRKYGLFSAVTRTLWSGTPIIVTLVTFGSFVAMGGNLDAPTAFVSMTLLQLLRFPMAMLPSMFSGAIEANVSFRRIEKFLNSPELVTMAPASPSPSRKGSMDISVPSLVHTGSARALDASSEVIRHQLMSPYPVVGQVAPEIAVGGPALEMIRGTYYWDDAREHLALHNVDLRLTEGEICIVTGEVGSGKTALLMALLGELVPDVDSVPYASLNGSVAYAPQVPWILNATVRDNIVFGNEYDEDFYNQVIEACALSSDLKILPQGDQSIVGDKGITLSGGQKARVSLARAVYSRSDILLLESCFEAVDEHVASILWQSCFFGLLKNVPSKVGKQRTVLVVTHSTKPEAERVDHVVIMSKGSVLLKGSPEELSSNPVYQALKRGGIAQSAKAHNSISEEGAIGTDAAAGVGAQATASEPSAPDAAPEKSKLVEEEKRMKRSVSKEVYHMYLRSLGGWPLFSLLMGISGFRVVADIATSRWLAHWSNDVEKGASDDHSLEYYLFIYAGFSFAALIFVSLIILTILFSTLASSRWYHDELLNAIIRAPMSFFDSTPLGRITQRFTKDIATLDNIMPNLLNFLVSTCFDVIGTLVVVAMVSPLFLIPLPFLFAGYYFTQRYYVRTSRELKNLDSISLSPVFSHFQETLEGCVSVRAYRHIDAATKLNYERLDDNLSAYYMSNSCNRWLAVRMESVANVLVLLASILTAAQHGHINASLAGMAVSYTLTVTQSLNWFVRSLCDFETNVVSVERIDEYAHQTPQEAALNLPNDPAEGSWPLKGEIIVQNIYARYRPDLDDVLRGLNMRIPPGSHVGVCGKTGCGKSTLFLILLRILEPYQGSILIDGVDTQKIGLKRLRDAISIIPQDAVLFQSSLRYNLDPSLTKTDAELWHALEITELSGFVKRTLVSRTDPTRSPLDVSVSESGSDFSFGQRQLLCIARALLRDTKILLSDEASSGIDRLTDRKIQEMIKREFASRTTLTIAHRLETVEHSDFVAVMDRGVVVEFDNPQRLMEQPNSRFFRLANDMRKGESNGSSSS